MILWTIKVKSLGSEGGIHWKVRIYMYFAGKVMNQLIKYQNEKKSLSVLVVLHVNLTSTYLRGGFSDLLRNSLNVN